ncbi:MAG TPA: 50S ribosomal protein L21 [Clostridia bacterium]|nr:50S ribosomal protein L21 [Clostridia bacterium]
MYAIIETGGQQFKVQEGDEIKIEKLPVEEGQDVVFERVLAIIGEDTNFGKPILEGAKVKATVLEQGRHDKVIIFKYNAKKNFHKKKGHRQPFTLVKINAIEA